MNTSLSVEDIFIVDRRKKAGRAESRLDMASRLTYPERKGGGRGAGADHDRILGPRDRNGLHG